MGRFETSVSFDDRELIFDTLGEVIRFVVFPVEAEPHHRMPDRPVPVAVNVESLEQGFVGFEQFPQSIDQKAFPEPARTGQEVEISHVDQPPDMGGLVDVVAVLLPDSPEGLDADRELAAGP